MIHRPLSITLVGASLISMGILSVWGNISAVGIITNADGLFSRNRELFILLVVTSAIEIIAGISILLGKNWARALWTSWYILNLGFKLALEIHTPLPYQVIQLLFIFLLFRAEADAFFETD